MVDIGERGDLAVLQAYEQCAFDAATGCFLFSQWMSGGTILTRGPSVIPNGTGRDYARLGDYNTLLWDIMPCGDGNVLCLVRRCVRGHDDPAGYLVELSVELFACEGMTKLASVPLPMESDIIPLGVMSWLGDDNENNTRTVERMFAVVILDQRRLMHGRYEYNELVYNATSASLERRHTRRITFEDCAEVRYFHGMSATITWRASGAPREISVKCHDLYDFHFDEFAFSLPKCSTRLDIDRSREANVDDTLVPVRVLAREDNHGASLIDVSAPRGCETSLRAVSRNAVVSFYPVSLVGETPPPRCLAIWDAHSLFHRLFPDLKYGLDVEQILIGAAPWAKGLALVRWCMSNIHDARDRVCPHRRGFARLVVYRFPWSRRVHPLLPSPFRRLVRTILLLHTGLPTERTSLLHDSIHAREEVEHGGLEINLWRTLPPEIIEHFVCLLFDEFLQWNGVPTREELLTAETPITLWPESVYEPPTDENAALATTWNACAVS